MQGNQSNRQPNLISTSNTLTLEQQKNIIHQFLLQQRDQQLSIDEIGQIINTRDYLETLSILMQIFREENLQTKIKISNILRNQLREDPQKYLLLIKIIPSLYHYAIRQNLWNQTNLIQSYHILIQYISHQDFQLQKDTQRSIYLLITIALKEINKQQFGQNQKQNLQSFISKIFQLLINNSSNISQFYQRILYSIARSQNQTILNLIKNIFQQNIQNQELQNQNVTFMVKVITIIIDCKSNSFAVLTKILKNLLTRHYEKINYQILAKLLKSLEQIIDQSSKPKTKYALNIIIIILYKSNRNQFRIKCVQRKNIRMLLKRVKEYYKNAFNYKIESVKELLERVR